MHFDSNTVLLYIPGNIINISSICGGTAVGSLCIYFLETRYTRNFIFTQFSREYLQLRKHVDRVRFLLFLSPSGMFM